MAANRSSRLENGPTLRANATRALEQGPACARAWERCSGISCLRCRLSICCRSRNQLLDALSIPPIASPPCPYQLDLLSPPSTAALLYPCMQCHGHTPRAQRSSTPQRATHPRASCRSTCVTVVSVARMSYNLHALVHAVQPAHCGGQAEGADTGAVKEVERAAHAVRAVGSHTAKGL